MESAQVKEAREHMRAAVEAVRHELATVRSGKASTAILDRVRVEAYGSVLPLNQLATVSAPEPRLILVSPYDRTTLAAIERAIQSSELGLTPSNDGAVVRIPIPPLTEERRRELVKVAHRIAEDGRVAVRHARQEANQRVKELEKKGELSADDSRRVQKEVQERTDEAIREIEAVLGRKEAEILEI
ncbi:MAG: ribosome recycling factor [Gemmatimonadetes bacterium]|nr:ribosome recycling factor [Gemmatimonadota bacterium]